MKCILTYFQGVGVFSAIALVACAEGVQAIVLDPDPPSVGSPEGGKLPDHPDHPDLPERREDASTPHDDDSGALPDACAKALDLLRFDFESGSAGWTHGVLDGVSEPVGYPYDPWEHGTASNGVPCATGTCFGAPLAQNYAQCHRGYLLSPSMDLSACQSRKVTLSFNHAYGFWSEGASFHDGGVLEISGDDGASWHVPAAAYPGMVKIKKVDEPSQYACLVQSFSVDGKQGFVGKQATTSSFEVVLPPSLVTSKTRVRFSLGGGLSSPTVDVDVSRQGTDFGWRIDDVVLSTK